MSKKKSHVLPEQITVEIDGEVVRVMTNRYVQVKVKQLREFGYPTVTGKEVEAQLSLLLAGKKWTDVIGGFVEGDNPRKATD